MPWSLSPGGTFAELGVTSCARTMQAGGRSTCEIVIAEDLATASSFNEDDEVSVSGPGGVFFTGVVDRPARTGEGTTQNHRISLTTKWKWLEETAYTQPFASGSGSAPVHKSSVVLGLDDDGTRQTAREIILGILTFANTQDAGISIGTILAGSTLVPPLMRMTDVTCAEAIRAVMRWHPDAVLWFAPDGHLHITRPEDMAGVSRAVGGAAATARCEIAPRETLAVRGVAVHYEITTTVDGQDYLSIEDDTAGSPGGRRVTHFTIPLQGDNIITQQQEIQTQDIPDEITELGDWLKLKFPEIAKGNPEAGDLVVHTFEQEVTADEKVGPGAALATYPRELIKGSIQPWMSGVSAAPTRITINIEFTGNAAAKPALAKLFNAQTRREDFFIELMGTDAEDQTYRTAGGTEGEEVPTGLAEAYYSAFQDPPPAGSYTNLSADADAGVYPGLKLSLSGSVTVANAPIQSSTTDAFGGETTVQFGPMNQALAPAGFLELQRAGQRQSPLVNPGGSIRTDAAAGAGGKTIHGATGSRWKNTSRTFTPADGVTPWQCVKVDELKLRIYPAAIKDGKGNLVWCEYEGVAAAPGSYFDIELTPSAGAGYVYLLCDVNDSDDMDGIIESAELLVSATPPAFNENIGLQVAIDLCWLSVGPTTFGFEALRTFLFTLRRYGPPGSDKWEAEPTG